MSGFLKKQIFRQPSRMIKPADVATMVQGTCDGTPAELTLSECAKAIWLDQAGILEFGEYVLVHRLDITALYVRGICS